MFALLATVIATTPVVLAGLNFNVNAWITRDGLDGWREVLDKHLAKSSAEIDQLRASLRDKLLESAARLSDAGSFIPPTTAVILARGGGSPMSVSPIVVAALPDAPSDLPAPVKLDESQIKEIAPAIVAPALAVAPVEVDDISGETPSENPAPEDSVATAEPASMPMLAEPAPVEVKVASTPENPMLASLVPGAAKPAAVAITVAPSAETELLREAEPVTMPEVTAIGEESPAPDVEPKAVREDKPEEKWVFASLGRQATAVDAHPLAAEPPDVEADAAPEQKPLLAEPQERPIDHFVTEASQATNVPISSPVKLRPLTRADIPPPEKLAGLGSTVQSDARNLPPEQQRVAYDAPVLSERPKSIGRRKWIDESQYSGLGSPEALLEALRHMGANAKTLGLPASLWCADFMNLVLRKSGLNATGSRAARSYLQYGKKIDEPRVGAIAIFTRGRNGGHIGIVRGTDGNGNPIIVSGNHNNKVAEAVYPKSRVLAYVVPK